MPLKALFLLLVHFNLFAIERIVALSPAVNEIIFSLGEGDKIVGNTDYCRFPSSSQSIAKVGGYFTPSLEKILVLKPDIVIMQDNNAATAEKLKQLGIRTMVFKINTLASIRKAIFDIGKLLGREKNAATLVTSIDRSVQSLRGITKNKRILIPIGYYTDLSKEVYIAGQNLYFDDLIEASGNINALQSDAKAQPVLNLEKIIKTNPDIVILLAPLMKEKKLTKEALIAPWSKLPITAAKTGAIFVETGDYAGVPSGRIVHFIDDFERFLRETEH